MLIMAVGAAVVVVLGLMFLWPRLQGARWAARLTHCNYNLRQIELALHSYHDQYGSYPPAVTDGPDGTPWHSWRVLILAHMEDAGEIYDRYRFDEPWNGPNNRKLFANPEAASIYCCPTEDRSEPITTSYLAVVGKHTLWPPERGCRRNEVTDSESRTPHVVEFSDSGIVWSEPRDLAFGEQTFEVQSGKGDTTVRSDHPSMPYVAYADGSTGPFYADTPPEAVKSMLLRDDGGPADVR